MVEVKSLLRPVKRAVDVFVNRLSTKLMRQPTVLGMDETIDVINSRRASIGRYGDGELG